MQGWMNEFGEQLHRKSIWAIASLLSVVGRKEMTEKKQTDRRIPYGVAIAFGAIACWLLQPPTQPTKMNVEDMDNRGLPTL